MLLRLFCLMLVLVSATPSIAQTNWPNPEAEKTYEKAKTSLSNGQFNEAIMLYKQVLAAAPDAIVAHSGLARAYLMTGKNQEAINQVDEFLDNGHAEEQMFQIAAIAYTKLGKTKTAANVFDKGLERYPSSGYLYYEYGKWLIGQRDAEQALAMWTKGINNCPEFNTNYYEAAYAYFFTEELVWTLLYSEIFLNTEYLTPRAKDVRTMMLNSYRNFYQKKATTKIIPEGSATNFYDAVEDGLLRFGGLLADGYTAENLTMMRIRFAMYWKQHYEQRFPFTLFQRHQTMIADGHFDAYNQFLMGEAADKNTYAAWLKMHSDSMEEFKEWLKKHPLKMTPADGYNPRKVKGVFPKKK